MAVTDTRRKLKKHGMSGIPTRRNMTGAANGGAGMMDETSTLIVRVVNGIPAVVAAWGRSLSEEEIQDIGKLCAEYHEKNKQSDDD